MKKLISAVTSICMTATMFTAVAPASVSALDDSKTLSLRTIGGGNTYTISAEEIAAGDVTLHCGLYLEEATEGEISSFQALFGIRDTSTGSMDDITMTSLIKDITGNYYDSNVDYTMTDGTTFSTKKLPFAFGGFNSRGNYAPKATNYDATYSDARTDLGANLPNIYCAWLAVDDPNDDTDNIEWLGSTSDEFPVCYFDITIKQGASGTYEIACYDDLFNDSPKNLQPVCNLGSQQVGYEYYAKNQDQGEGLLNLESLIINVGDNGDSSTTTTTTTTTNPAKTTTTTTTTPDPGKTTTTTTTTGPIQGDKVVLDYLYEDGADCYTVKPGEEIFVDMSIDSKGQKFWGFDISLLADDGIEITEVLEESEAWNSNVQCKIVDKDRFGNPTSALVNAGYTALKEPEAGLAAISMTVSVPADTAPGTYYINMPYLYLQLTQSPEPGIDPEYLREGDVDYRPAKIVVEGDVPPTTTTTTTTTSTTTTTTTTTPIPGERLLGDANEDGKVNVADVVVLNKCLAGQGDLSDQGKINSEVTNPTLKVEDVDLTYEDSKYIIQSIIHLWTLTDNGPVATEYNGK